MSKTWNLRGRPVRSQVAAAKERGGTGQARKVRSTGGGQTRGPIRLGLVSLKTRGQVTLSEAARVLRVKVGDYLEVTIEGDRIVLTPVKVIPRDELYLLSPGWQRQLAEAVADEESGLVHTAESADDVIRLLERDDDGPGT